MISLRNPADHSTSKYHQKKIHPEEFSLMGAMRHIRLRCFLAGTHLHLVNILPKKKKKKVQIAETLLKLVKNLEKIFG